MLPWDVSDGGKLLVRDVWYEGSPSPAYLHITGLGTLTMEGLMVAYSLINESTPTFDINNFKGNATFINDYTTGNWAVSGDGTQARVLGVGLNEATPTTTYFSNNASPAATVGLLQSMNQTTSGIAEPTPNIGTLDDTFVKDMFAQTRDEEPRMLTALPAGVTDLRLFRVYVANSGTNNLVFSAGGDGKPAAPPTGAAPTVQVSIDHSDVNIASQQTRVTVALNEPISDFIILASTTVTGGALSNLQTTDGGKTYTATFTPTANTDISNASVGVIAGSYHDLAGNAGTGGSTPLFTVDTVTPTVAVTTSNSYVNVAHNTPTVTFTFSEAPNPFVLADTAATGGTLSNLVKVDATHYTATFTSAANTLINNASVSVTSGSWSENNGNPGAGGATANFTIDTFDHWINSAGGDWATAANWGNGVPTANLAADIDASGTYTVTIYSGDTADGLLINAAGATVSDNTGGSLSITGSGGPSNPNGALTISAGSFALPGGGLTAGSISIANGGALLVSQSYTGPRALAESITNNGSITISNASIVTFNGAISGSGSVTVQN